MWRIVARRRLDVGMIGNGAIAALVAITAPAGYVELWAAPLIGVVAGVLVVFSVLAIDRVLDDPVVVAFTVVFTLSYLAFAAIKALFGLRVTAEEEREGLDLVEHGMYGYPEQFVVGDDGIAAETI